MEADLGAQGLKGDWEILVGHLACEACLNLPAAAARGVDLPEVARDEQRRKEWKSLNVIPMGVRDEEMAMGRTVARRHQGASALVCASAAIEYHKGTVGGAHFHTGGIATIA